MRRHDYILLALLLLELGVFGAIVPGYLSLAGLLDGSRTFVATGLLALGMTLVIVSGGIDLSVASLLALVSVVVGLSYRAGCPMLVSLLLGLLTGVAGGLVNGIAIACLRVHPLIVTLATMALYRGAAYAISNAAAVSRFPDTFTDVGQGSIAGLIPISLPLWVAAIVVMGVILHRTRFGRYVYALGANETATRFSGVPIAATRIAIYAAMGVLVALAAIVETARLSTARANASLGLELSVIAMVVLGGTRITGGAGTIIGTVLGVLVLAFLQDGLEYAGVRADWTLIVTGLFLIVGVVLQRKERS